MLLLWSLLLLSMGWEKSFEEVFNHKIWECTRHYKLVGVALGLGLEFGGDERFVITIIIIEGCCLQLDRRLCNV